MANDRRFLGRLIKGRLRIDMDGFGLLVFLLLIVLLCKVRLNEYGDLYIQIGVRDYNLEASYIDNRIHD
jgi:hypothetical protein